MVLAQAFAEIEQTNLTAGTRSRKIPLDDLRDAIAQTSLTDTTADRLMKVGAGGLLSKGVGGSPTVSYTADLDSLTTTPAATTFFIFQSTATNLPSGFAEAGAGIHFRRAVGGGESQIIYGEGGSKVYFRGRVTGSWSAWVQLLESGSYPSDSAWTTTTSPLNGWTGTVRYIKRAGMVTVILDALNGSAQTDPTVLVMPSGYRPGVNSYSTAIGTTGADVPLSIRLDTSGNFDILGDGSSNTGISGQITFPVIT